MKTCFWPQCSNRARCAEHGSCVALAQRENIMESRKYPVNNAPTRDEIRKALFGKNPEVKSTLDAARATNALREEQIGYRGRKVDDPYNADAMAALKAVDEMWTDAASIGGYAFEASLDLPMGKAWRLVRKALGYDEFQRPDGVVEVSQEGAAPAPMTFDEAMDRSYVLQHAAMEAIRTRAPDRRAKLKAYIDFNPFVVPK